MYKGTTNIGTYVRYRSIINEKSKFNDTHCMKKQHLDIFICYGDN